MKGPVFKFIQEGKISEVPILLQCLFLNQHSLIENEEKKVVSQLGDVFEVKYLGYIKQHLEAGMKYDGGYLADS